MSAPNLLTLNEVAAHCRVHRRTVSRWIEAGRLPVVRIVGVVRIRLEDLEKLIDGAS